MLPTHQILSSRVMGTQVDIGEILELHVPRACSTPVWLSIPILGRGEIYYHRAGGTHEPEAEVSFGLSGEETSRNQKVLEIRVLQPLKDAMPLPPPPPGQVGSTTSVLCLNGPGWMVFLTRWGKGQGSEGFPLDREG